MIRLKGTERTFISKELIGFADKLAKEGTVAIRLDLLMLGFSYAIQQQLPPVESFTKHELVRTQSLGENIIAYEAAANWYAKELGLLEKINNGNDLADFICRVGVAGLSELQKEWEVKSKSQIQWHIMQLAGEQKDV